MIALLKRLFRRKPYTVPGVPWTCAAGVVNLAQHMKRLDT
jgi:hypothetical protein